MDGLFQNTGQWLDCSAVCFDVPVPCSLGHNIPRMFQDNARPVIRIYEWFSKTGVVVHFRRTEESQVDQHDQDAAFVMLERNGKVLATTGPVHPSDARLRRSQGLAHETGIALKIARELIVQKLLGQEQVIRKFLKSSEA